MSKILVISGHINLKNSFANKAILDNLQQQFGENIEISKLDILYPQYVIDVQKEREKLSKADIIIFQFPFFWFSMPSILRCWCEQVLSIDWAYKTHCSALNNKPFIVSFTLGAKIEEYKYEGAEGFELGYAVPQFIQLSNLCCMKYCGYIYSDGYGFIDDINIKNQKVKEHCEKLTQKINNIINNSK